MRGLKHFCLNWEHHWHKVASFTDAWIETEVIQRLYVFLPVASFTDAWIETSVMSRLKDAGLVASFTDAWIETSFAALSRVWRVRRIFYRCVD